MPQASIDIADARVAYLVALCRTVPFHIVERVLREPTEHALSPQEFDGSIMFADLVGFTALCERLADKGSEGLSLLSTLLDRLFEEVLEGAIFPYEGYVVHFGGDSLTVAYRGEGHAQRAAASALAAQRLMHGEMGRLPGGQRHELMLRVGIASGPIRLWVVGDLVRRGVVSSGAIVHRAVALKKAAAPGAVLADHSTVEWLGADAELIDRTPERAVLRGLRVWPVQRDIADLTSFLQAQIEEKIALLEPFVPDTLAAHLKNAPLGWRLPGELRDAVIVSVELAGIDEAVGLREVALNLSRSLLRAYRKFGGEISKVDLAEHGHRIMVLFGLHDAQENDVERSLLASLEATTRLKGFTLAKKLDLVVRIGIHKGKVFSGAIGSDNKHDITVVGDAVNVAARAVQQAEPFEVVATDTVIESVKDAFAATAREPIMVKGRSVPLKLFAVQAASTGRARYVRRREHQRFCAGRAVEIEALMEVVARAQAGRGQYVGMMGGAGTGKSFMLANLIDTWVAKGGLGVIGRCRYAGRSEPFAPIVNVFHNFLGLSASDSEHARRDRIRKGLRELGASVDIADLIALLEPVHRPDGTTEALADLADPQARERVLVSALKFFELRAAQGPLLVILEDLHLADTLTLELARRVATVSRERRFLLLATYRPEPTVQDLRRVFDLEIELHPLTPAQTCEVICHELQGSEVDTSVARFIFERTQGNPEHLVEVIRFLVDHQLLFLRGGVVVAADPGVQLLDDIVPRTLAQVVMARLERLGAVERRLLRLASVIGNRFGRGLLQIVSEADLQPELVDVGVAKLVSQGVISAEPEGAPGYVFRDNLTRAVTYGTIPDPERLETHRRIADALERLPHHDPARNPTTLAMHRERANQWVESLRWYFDAIRVASAGGLDRETRGLVERWQRVTERVAPDELPERRLFAEVRVANLLAAGRLGLTADVLKLGRQIVQEHAADLAPHERARVDLAIGEALISLGKPEKARERLQAAFATGRDAHVRADAARLLGRTFELAHRADEAHHWLDEAMVLCQGDAFRMGRIEVARANLDADAGNLDRAAAIYARVREAALKAGLLHLRLQATGNLAYVEMLAMHFEAAHARFDESLALARALGLWHDEAQDLVNLGQCCIWEGALDAAMHHLDRGLAIANDIGEQAVAAEAMVHLGVVVALTSDPNAGQALCEEGYHKAARAGVREVEAVAELHLLRIAVARQDAKAAEVALHRCVVSMPHLRWPVFKAAYEELKNAATPLIG